MVDFEKRVVPLVGAVGIFGKVPDYVLVEEELGIRDHWIRVALKNGLSLAVYDSPEGFLTDLSLFQEQTRFYLDQDFGSRRGVGVALARKIKARLNAFVSLVTAYSRADFVNEISAGILDEVYGKFPPPFNLANSTCPWPFNLAKILDPLELNRKDLNPSITKSKVASERNGI